MKIPLQKEEPATGCGGQTKSAQASRELRKKYLAMGICVTCGQADAAPGKAGCPTCLEKRRHAEKEKTSAAKAGGLCISCGQKPTAPGKSFCPDCPARGAAWRLAHKKSKIQPDA